MTFLTDLFLDFTRSEAQNVTAGTCVDVPLRWYRHAVGQIPCAYDARTERYRDRHGRFVPRRVAEIAELFRTGGIVAVDP